MRRRQHSRAWPVLFKSVCPLSGGFSDDPMKVSTRVRENERSFGDQLAPPQDQMPPWLAIGHRSCSLRTPFLLLRKGGNTRAAQFSFLSDS